MAGVQEYEYQALDVASIWDKAWVLVGLTSDFAVPGDYVTTEITGRPVMVVKGECI